MHPQTYLNWQGQNKFSILCAILVVGLILSSCSDKPTGNTQESAEKSALESPELLSIEMVTPDLPPEQFSTSDGHKSKALDLLEGVTPKVELDGNFKVFDGTYFRPVPWALNNYGLKDIEMLYPPTMWGESTAELEGTTHMPDKERVTRAVQDASSKGITNLCINIEHWPLEGSDSEIESSIDRFIKLINWIKEVDPDMQVGFYGVPPIRKFGMSTKDKDSATYQEWVDMNLKLQRLANNVDAFYPSLYTYNDDREKWVTEAIAQTDVLEQLAPGKPVYFFMWPEYHPYLDEFAGKLLETNYWKVQQKTARKFANGYVVWTPSRMEWNNDYSWWVATRRFMVNLGQVYWTDDTAWKQ